MEVLQTPTGAFRSTHVVNDSTELLKESDAFALVTIARITPCSLAGGTEKGQRLTQRKLVSRPRRHGRKSPCRPPPGEVDHLAYQDGDRVEPPSDIRQQIVDSERTAAT